MATPTKEERTVEILVNGTKANASLKEMGAAAAVLSAQVAKIAADDPKRAELIAQLQTMRQRMADARAEINGLLTAEQQLAATQQQLTAAQAASVAEQTRAIAAGKLSTASFAEMKTAAGLLEHQLHELSADDPGRAAMIADYQALKTRMSAARQEMEVTAKTEAQLRAEQDALRASQVQLVVNGQKVSASMREMREAAAQLEKELDELAHDDPARGPLIASLQQLKGRIKEVGQEVAGVSETTSKMKEVMTRAFSYVIGEGIEEAIFKVIELGKDIFDTTAKFETYGKVLGNALGSDSAAQKALADIQTMAAQTPFSVDELTESFLKLVNRGLNPSMAEMTKMGDLASSQGKSFNQLTEAVLDAATGEFERLKEFGIQAHKSGDEVSLSFKGVQQVVANTPEAIQGALLSFGELKGVMGGMAIISGTLEGQLSNLGDTADQTAVEWGQTLRPVFIAVLSTLGFLLGALKALPGFIKENRGVLIALAGAVLTFNAGLVQSNALLLYNAALSKGKVVWDGAVALSTKAWEIAQRGLNLALAANPIGAVIAVGTLLLGLFIGLYDKSEKFRAVVNGLGAAFMALVTTIKDGVIENLTGLGDLLTGIFTLNPAKIKQGLEEVGGSIKTIYWDAGKKAAGAFHQGYADTSKANQQDFTDILKASLTAGLKQLDAAAKARQAAEKAARLEKLKNEEADLTERLARAKKDSETEMRLKQQLVTNAAAQELEDVKKTAAERRIILAEAEQKRAELAQTFFEKQAKDRAAARKKAQEEALKRRLAEIEAEQHHQEMLLKLRQAALVARGDERVSELSAIYTDGELKIAALKATSEKEIAQLVGTAKQKAARRLDLEKQLAADIALVRADVRQKQQEKEAKYQEEDLSNQKEFIDKQLGTIEEEASRKQAAFDVMFDAGLLSQKAADAARYQARQAAFAQELALIEASLGKESAEYKKVLGAQLKNEQDYDKQVLAERQKAEKAKQTLAKMEMSTAGDVLSFGLELLDKDKEARQKHHQLYVALAAAKIIIDGTKEVQQIWEYSAENPANGPTAGTAGIIMGGIQTALAVARTTVALAQLGKSSGAGSGSYWAGGATGDGGGLAVSPMGQLLAMSGMSVGAGGKLQDGSGFAVAGVVHEDEYVIPKWQRQDPQVAAVEQWLEARRMRGFYDGGPTSSGAQLPVPAASPRTDGELTYAVLAQLLDQAKATNAVLADVANWPKQLQVVNSLQSTKAGLDELTLVQQNSAIRSKP